MDGAEINPFEILTMIVAPAILTNASTLNALATSNRLARVVDRIRALSREAEGSAVEDEGADGLRQRLLRFAERRTTLLVRSLKAFYASVGAFAAASLISLLAAASLAAHQDVLRQIAMVAALAAGVVGFLGLVYGSALLVWETRTTLESLTEETAFRVAKGARDPTVSADDGIRTDR